jgi:hypothetical protein
VAGITPILAFPCPQPAPSQGKGRG